MSRLTKSRTIASAPLKNIIDSAGWPLAATVFGLIFGAAIITASGENPFSVYGVMFQKSFFESWFFMQVLTRASPVIMCALAAAVSWRAGYINLGMEGQMATGGFVATVCALFIPGPAWLVMTIAIVLGCLAGALYALFPTILYWKCNASLIITTLMLNYVARFITSYYVSFPFKDTAGDGLADQTAVIDQSLRFTRLSPTSTFNTGFIIAILAVIAVLFIVKRTVFGYESKMGGLNPSFARYGGIKQTKIMMLTMGLSGALAGLGGCIEVFGVKYRFIDAMFSDAGYAWTGLMAALIGKFHPAAILIYAIFLVGLDVGGQALQRSYGLPLQIAQIIQCAITLFVSVQIAIRFKKRKKAEVQDDSAGSTNKEAV